MSWVVLRVLTMSLLVAFAVVAVAPVADASEDQAEVRERQEVSQYGITWRFDRPVKSGQFINGDWWVIGPVTVVGITPAPGRAPSDQTADVKLDQWGNTSMRDDNAMRNGSMVILRCGPNHGYDSRSAGYDP